MTQKESLELYRRYLTIVSKLKLTNISVTMSIRFGDIRVADIDITVFNKASNNKSFYIYGFEELEYAEKRLSGFVNAIKHDDFSKI